MTTMRPLIMANRASLASGHYLATAAGVRAILAGGNAVDAAAAMVFCLNVLEPEQNGMGGECPVLVRTPDGTVKAISGMGTAPAALTIEWCAANGLMNGIPGDGLVPACVPAMVGTWALAVAEFGRLEFADALVPAMELARDGFPMYERLHCWLLGERDRIARDYPSTAPLFFRNGAPIPVGEPVRNPALARTFELLISEGRKGVVRKERAESAASAFYRGVIADEVCRFGRENTVIDSTGTSRHGLLTPDDFADWHARIEEPVSIEWKGWRVFKCSSWTQGPVMLQQLQLLKALGLNGLDHNSAAYTHRVVEASKLAYADREAWYGDPDFDEVPFDVLLSDGYALERAKLVSECVSLELRPGSVGGRVPDWAGMCVQEANRRAVKRLRNPHNGDTTQLVAADAEGFVVSATPSGGWIRSSPIVPSVGFALGTRAQMFYLDPRRPNSLAPGKRPRCTLTPSMAVAPDGRVLGFGSPGGDAQDQTSLQFFLNVAQFGLDIARAAEMPSFYSEHWPDSFWPRKAYPGQVAMEGRISQQVRDDLAARGHVIRPLGPWGNGSIMCAALNANGLTSAAATPRRGVACAFGV